MENKEFYTEYINVFLEQNSRLNLISKNDEKFLWEKHIYDSLAIEKLFEKMNLYRLKLLDIGTGGGFPAVPIALTYPMLNVTAVDSIRKKINAIDVMKTDLKLDNLTTICERAENLTDKFDIITSRAVASLKIISNYALPLLEQDGYFVAYKSKKVLNEIDEAQNVLQKYHAKITGIIEYELPLNENHIRNLVVIRKCG